MVSDKKIKQVQNIIDLLNPPVGATSDVAGGQKDFILVKFRQTPHHKLEELRRQLKKTNAKFKVVKNRLLEKAINKLSDANKLLTQFRKAVFPLREETALLTMGKNWDKTLSEFYKFIKDQKTLNFKVGVIENQVYESEILQKIAELPPKEQLMTQVIVSIKAPLNNVVYAMKFNLQKLVYVLKAKSVR